MSRRMTRRKRQKVKRRIVWRAVSSGVTSVDEIRAILARHGHRPHDDAILFEIERARQQIKEEQDRAVRAEQEMSDEQRRSFEALLEWGRTPD